MVGDQPLKKVTACALADVLDEAVVRDLECAYFGDDLHYAPVEELAERFDSDLSRGLTMELASSKMRAADGLNALAPPQPCPAWLCCLLPCLRNTPAMHSFESCVPQSAQALRSGRGMCLDPLGLVQGDIVSVQEGDIVPADCRIVACEDLTVRAFDCEDAILSGHCAAGSPRETFLEARSVLLAGSLILSGQAKALVVHTGSRTVMAALIQRGVWPIGPHVSPGDRQRLLPL